MFANSYLHFESRTTPRYTVSCGQGILNQKKCDDVSIENLIKWFWEINEFDEILTHSLIRDPPQNWSPHPRVNATFHGYWKASVCSPPTILSPSMSALEPQCLSFRLSERARIESYPCPLPVESRRSAVSLVICYCKIQVNESWNIFGITIWQFAQ